jgi:hypothetical protein
MNQWSRKDAEARFGEVIEAARTAPQLVQEGSVPVAVVITPDTYASLNGETPAAKKTVTWNGRELTLVELLLAMPKGGPDDLFERRHPRRREIDF